MTTEKLKETLHQIADSVNDGTRLDDIYDQLALLADIEEIGRTREKGRIHSS